MERKEILLVEDDEGDSYLAESLLRGSEFAFSNVATLREAIEVYHESAPDLVLLDLGLPDSRGLETYYRFRAACPGARIIVWSGWNDEQVARSLKARGALGYIVKSYLTFDSRTVLRDLCCKALEGYEEADSRNALRVDS